LNSFAQTRNFGIQGGINISTLNLSEIPVYPNTEKIVTYEPMISYSINAYYEKLTDRKYFFSIEPGYIRKGAIQKLYNNNSKVVLELHYIQVPILINFLLVNNLYLHAGLETSYLLNANYKFKKEKSSSIKERYSELIDLAGLFGLNYCLTDNLSFGLRYSHSILPISKTLWFADPFGQPSGGRVKERHQYVQLTVRYLIFKR
jgi:hypothetical protein